MVDPSRRLVFVLSGFALFGAAYFWYPTPVHKESPLVTLDSIANNVAEEPITPLPLSVKLDERKVALGRLLFNDPKLSVDNTISCSYCHKLESGGADGLARPIGRGGRVGQFNTLTVLNSGFNFRYFWDGRAATLEEQLDFHLLNSAEMGSTWPQIIAKLQKDKSYARAFSDIYQEGIKENTIKDAIATFERSLITPNSRFDRFLRGDRNALNAQEKAGYDLFKSLGCISCHQGMNVGGNLYEKLGLIEDYFLSHEDMQGIHLGRYNITRKESDRYKFRVPSLRNVALTAPYLHDGSANSLEVAVAIVGKYQLGVELREDEIDKIVSFLEALTGEFKDWGGN